jgi:hypothetical protein
MSGIGDVEIPVRLVIEPEEFRELLAIAREMPEFRARMERLEKVTAALAGAVLGGRLETLATLEGDAEIVPPLEVQLDASRHRLSRGMRRF